MGVGWGVRVCRFQIGLRAPSVRWASDGRQMGVLFANQNLYLGVGQPRKVDLQFLVWFQSWCFCCYDLSKWLYCILNLDLWAMAEPVMPPQDHTLGIVPKLFPQAPPAPWPMQDMVDTPPAKRQLFSSPGSFPASDSQVGLRVPLIWKNYVKLLGIIYCHDSDLFSTA